jgi:biotin carboxylase
MTKHSRCRECSVQIAGARFSQPHRFARIAARQSFGDIAPAATDSSRMRQKFAHIAQLQQQQNHDCIASPLHPLEQEWQSSFRCFW